MVLTAGLWACSTVEVEPLPPLPETPKYLQVPHPEGYDIGDLQAIFKYSKAPASLALDACDRDFGVLMKKTQSLPEITQGVFELVKQDPEAYHYCFYDRLSKMREGLGKLTSQSDRQRSVLDSYFFLVPVARAFKAQFQDSRYLRQAIYHYQIVAEWVFYRKVVPSAETTSELALKDYLNPFALYRDPQSPGTSVLEKYGLKKPAAAHSAPMPSAELDPAPVTPSVTDEARTPAADPELNELVRDLDPDLNGPALAP